MAPVSKARALAPEAASISGTTAAAANTADPSVKRVSTIIVFIAFSNLIKKCSSFFGTESTSDSGYCEKRFQWYCKTYSAENAAHRSAGVIDR